MFLKARERIRRALIWTAVQIPVIQALTSFESSQHKEALKKFFSLWLLSIVPGLFSFYMLWLSQPQTHLANFRTAFTPAEQFIYAVSFLSPVLYLIWERHQQKERYIDAGKRSPDLLARVPKGFGFVLLVAVLVFVYTAFAFGAAKAWEQETNPLQHHAAQVALKSAIWIYLYGIFCWYLTILMSVDAESDDFVSQTRAQEKAVTQELGKRVGSKGEKDV